MLFANPFRSLDPGTFFLMGPPIQIFNATVNVGFQVTDPVMLVGESFSFDFLITVTTAAKIEYFLEFTGADPNDAATQWYREVAEEDVGSGVVNMPVVVRDFQENATGAVLPVGVHALSNQFTRRHLFARAQIQAASGAATVQVEAINVLQAKDRTPT